MNKEIFQIPGYIVRDKSLTGGGRQFVIETQENLTPEHLQRLISLENKLGWFTFSVEIIEAVDLLQLKDIKIDISKYDKGKTPGNRLRSVFYLIHEKMGGTNQNFQAFYEEKMEKLIEHFKNKLHEMEG